MTLPIRCLVHVCVSTLVLFTVWADESRAEILSVDSEFGEDTATLDTETDILWLDVTLSTSLTFADLLIELEPGGEFESYRLANSDEVLEFWENAGINVQSGFLNQFTEENFESVTALMALVGVTSTTGSLGGGNFFDFTSGMLAESHGETILFLNLASDPDDTMTARPAFGSRPTDNASPSRGAWLVPEPSDLMLSCAAVASLAVLAMRRAPRRDGGDARRTR